MTHDKNRLDVLYSFSPVSLKDAERFAQLEKNLERVIMQYGMRALPESLVENHEWEHRDQTVSSAIRNSTPNVWIFGLKMSTPCV